MHEKEKNLDRKNKFLSLYLYLTGWGIALIELFNRLFWYKDNSFEKLKLIWSLEEFNNRHLWLNEHEINLNFEKIWGISIKMVGIVSTLSAIYRVKEEGSWGR